MNRIKELRKEIKLSQTSLAEYMNVTGATVSNWENGVHDISTDDARRMAALFNCSLDYLFCRSDDRNAKITDESIVSQDEELMSYLEELRSRPEMRMLFSLAKGATKKDVEDAVKIVEMFLNRGN